MAPFLKIITAFALVKADAESRYVCEMCEKQFPLIQLQKKIAILMPFNLTITPCGFRGLE